MKAVAIPYIIALVLGVIIIGILGYWFVSQGGKTIGGSISTECFAKQMSFCRTWRDIGFDDTREPIGFTWDSSCQKPTDQDTLTFTSLKCMDLLKCRANNVRCNVDEISYVDATNPGKIVCCKP